MREGLHKIVSSDETIVAIATPLGRSGIGVIRLSGSAALSIAVRFFKSHNSAAALEHRQAAVGVWQDAQGSTVDEVVLTFFRAPSSYTGEDVIEISAHGNPVTMGKIVQTARNDGARLAAPGEFTLRAVAHGKMDLLQAEAVREFVDAQTEQQAKTALRQMEGALSKRIAPVKQKLVDVIAHLEAGIDFAEDDVDVPDNRLIGQRIQPLVEALEDIRQTFGYGKILAAGLRLAILGKPNVGKSSLFNRFVSADRAIVTDIPGTTRDVLTETIDMDGVPLRFADTAGVRQTSDRVESLGVSRTFEALSDADLALVVLDGSSQLDDNDRQVLAKVKATPHIIVVNKEDLPQHIDLGSLNGAQRVHVSATTGQGLQNLFESVRAFVLDRKSDSADDLVLTSARQYEAIGRGAASLCAASEALASTVPHEMVLIDLYQALSALDELTGEVVTEDILDRIFSTFCIGK
jgi:tRNA modification GTPase